jgi:integrase
MLFHNNGGKVWWTMFRDPRRPGKYIRKSTGTTVLSEARSIEQAEHLAIKRQITETQLKGVFDAIFGKVRELQGLPLEKVWIDYEKFIKRKDKQPGEKMMRDRKRNLSEFIEWSKKEYPVSTIEEVTFDCALAYADYLKRKRKLKDKSRKEYISNLSSIWNGLGALRELRNPWKDVRPSVRDGQRHGAFTREQERAILDAARACPVPHWYEASLIARWTGLRKHDVALLEWKAVDFEKGVIRTDPIKTQGYDISVEVPMVAELRAALERLPRKGRRYVLPDFAAAYPKAPQKYEFSSVLAAAKIEDSTLTFHSWRHTFRTRLAEAGVSNDLAKRLGGWTQDATVQRYDHADKTEEIRRALESTKNLHQKFK